MLAQPRQQCAHIESVRRHRRQCFDCEVFVPGFEALHRWLGIKAWESPFGRAKETIVDEMAPEGATRENYFLVTHGLDAGLVCHSQTANRIC